MTAIGIIGIVIALALFIILTYKGLNSIVGALLCILVIMLANGMDILETFNTVYLPGVNMYVGAMFGVVILSCIIAELYTHSGGAASIANAVYLLFSIKARRSAGEGKTVYLTPLVAIIASYVIGVVLAYSGFNAMVMLLVVFPICIDILGKANIPRYLMPGIVFGSMATAACSMPGTTSDQNIIAAAFLGTGPMAAAIPGFITGIVVLAINVIWMNAIAKKKIAAGDVYIPVENGPTSAEIEQKKQVHWALAIIPLLATIICYNVLRWDILICLSINVVLSMILFWPYLNGIGNIGKTISSGVGRGAGLLISVGALGAIGSVIAATPVFETIVGALLNNPLPGLFKAVLAIMLLTAATASAPGGLSASLPVFGPIFTQMGIPATALHRVATFSSQTLDSLPTNPAMPIIAGTAKVTMKESYKYIFCTTCITTTIGALLIALLLTVFPGLA